MKKSRAILTVLITVSGVMFAVSQPAESLAATKRALLVGINLYQPKGTNAQHPTGCVGGRCDLPSFANLEGSLNDVAAMRDLLASSRFGFAPQNIAVLTDPGLPATQRPYFMLPPSKTTHDGLIAVMRSYLVDIPEKGDTVVFYYAGHGSLRVNSKGAKLAMLVNGRPSHADSTLVPSDAWTGSFDVRDREMTEIFDRALDKGVKLTVILDSCHSGSFTRGVELGKKLANRSIEFDPRDINEVQPTLPGGESKPSPSERKDNPAIIFSAAQQDQTAKERLFGDTPSTSLAHGAFTVALIRALQTLPVDAPAEDVYRKVRATLEGEGVGDQAPSIDAARERLSQPLFGGMNADLSKARANVIATDDEGMVLLDAGRLSGINVGSEFLGQRRVPGQEPVKLQVASLDGLTHARAKIIAPLRAKVAIGEGFVLNKWVPLEVEKLHVWTWPANVSFAALQIAIDQVKASGLTLLDDPVEQPWTDMLAWNGTAWELRHAAANSERPLGPALNQVALSAFSSALPLCVTEPGSLTHDDQQALAALGPSAVRLDSSAANCRAFLHREAGQWNLRTIETASIRRLGTTFTAQDLEQYMGSTSRVWVNLPPPRELAVKLNLHDSQNGVAAVDDLNQAEYVLVGTLTEDGPAWSWFRKAEYMTGPRTTITHDHSPGCSTDSPYPVRSDWVPLKNEARAPDSAAALNTDATRLFKVQGWLNLIGDPLNDSAQAYYKIAFRRVSDGSILGENEAAQEDDRFRLVLRSDSPITQPRWVYVLDIDCHGKGTLIFPVDTGDNRFPNNADSPDMIDLPGAPTVHVEAPYGMDTVLLISTQEPLPDPFAMNFEGVSQRRGTARGVSTPLQQLLTNTSNGTRGVIPDIPTDWSVDEFQLRSIPRSK